MKRFLVFIWILLTTGLYPQSLDFSGYLRNYSGMRAGNGNTDFVILQNTFSLNMEKNMGGSAFKINTMLYHNGSANDSILFKLREAYLDLYFDKFDIRIGKQQIVWGKADGVFITDIVSPKDLYEFLLPEFDEIRIGVTGIKLNYYLGDSGFELVWLPVFNPTNSPEQNSIWYPSSGLNLAAAPDLSKQNVAASLKNSEIFLKYSSLTGVIDFELMAGYTWDDDPAMFFSMTPGPSGISLTVNPEYKRISLAGGSLSSTLGPLVIRSEAAYYFGKYFNTANPATDNGTIVKDYIHYMLGADFMLWNINFSAQYIQKAIIDYEPVIISNNLFNGQYSDMVTFLAKYSMLNETLNLELFTYYDFEFDDSLIRPRVLYDYSDSINLQFGANIFTGEKGQFGQFDKNDMIYGKIIYSF